MKKKFTSSLNLLTFETSNHKTIKIKTRFERVDRCVFFIILGT